MGLMTRRTPVVQNRRMLGLKIDIKHVWPSSLHYSTSKSSLRRRDELIKLRMPIANLPTAYNVDRSARFISTLSPSVSPFEHLHDDEIVHILACLDATRLHDVERGVRRSAFLALKGMSLMSRRIRNLAIPFLFKNLKLAPGKQARWYLHITQMNYVRTLSSELSGLNAARVRRAH